MKKNVLITGATGFIGGHLVDRFLSRGDNVHVLANSSKNQANAFFQNRVTVIRGDVRQFESVARAMSGIDIVIHCAAAVTDWASKKEYREVTVGGTRNICKAATKANVSRLVHISTNEVFGRSEKSVIDESNPLRFWREPGPDHKIKADEICWLYHREQRTPITMVYPCRVYGKHDHTFVAELADTIFKKESIFWRKKALIWPTYIDNLVDLIVRISEDERAIGQGYLVHDGESTTLQDFYRKIAKSLDIPPVARHVPYFISYIYAVLQETLHGLTGRKSRPRLTTYMIKNRGTKLRFSIDKAYKELEWQPEISFEEGFERTMDWLKTVNPNRFKTR